MYYLLSPKVIDTNPTCLIRNEVTNNRSEPTVEVSLCEIFYLFIYYVYYLKILFIVNGESVLFKCNNLTVLEIFQQFNKHITVLAPKEEVVEISATKTDKKRKIR